MPNTYTEHPPYNGARWLARPPLLRPQTKETATPGAARMLLTLTAVFWSKYIFYDTHSNAPREQALSFLSCRDRQPELMDQPGLDASVHRHALAGLGKANALSRVAQQIWRAITKDKIQRVNGSPLRVLDIASGGGDVAIRIATLAHRDGVPIEICGCDISATAIAYARFAAEQAGFSNLTFRQLNALTDPLEEYDVVMNTLFLHHLGDEEARELLRRMAAAARQLAIVDDLQRTGLGYFYAWAGVRLLTGSQIVHTDGPLSVRAAFTRHEAAALARDAGWRDIRIQAHWPQRFLMSWKKL